MISKENFGHEQLMTTIKDAEYKAKVLKNGYCVGLMELGNLDIGYTFTSPGLEYEVIDIKLTTIFDNYKLIFDGDITKHPYAEREETNIVIYVSCNTGDDINGYSIDNIEIGLGKKNTADIGVRYTDKDIQISNYKQINVDGNFSCFETREVIWIKLKQTKNILFPKEIWFRFDIANNCGEIYLTVAPKISMILSMTKR